MKKVILGFILSIFMIAPNLVQAEGELVWQHDRVSAPALPYSDIAVSADGVFSPYWISWGEIGVEKRTLNNSSGWKSSFAVPVDAWVQGYPRIAADSTGVYVAVASAISANTRLGTLSVAKLSPVSGAVLQVTHSNDSRYINVTDVEVDGSGVYVSGGGDATSGNGRWRVEKWYKDLSSRDWGYTSMLSDGNMCDYWGPVMAANSSSLYLGGCRYNAGAGTNSGRLARVNKNTGAEEWVRLEPWGTIGISVIAADNLNVYTAKTDSVFNGFMPWSPILSFDYTSYLEKRTLDNNPVIWSISTPDFTRSLNIHSGAIYRTYLQGGDSLILANMDKRSSSDGSQLGVLNINSTVSLYTGPAAGFFPALTVGSVDIDSSAIYIAGKNDAVIGWSIPYTARIEKYNHFGSVIAASCGSANGISVATAPVPTSVNPPNNLCTGGTAPIVTETIPSFNWTCDGPDNIDSTADDVSCFAPKTLSPSTISAISCEISIGNSTCTGSLTWNIQGATSPNVRNTDHSTTYSNNAIGNSEPIQLWYGVNTIWARDNTTNLVTTNPSPIIVNCVIGGIWNGSICESVTPPPIIVPIDVRANPNLIRSGDTAEIVVTINTTNPMSCTLLNAEGATVPFTHTGAAVPEIHTFTTRPLTAAQVVTANCVGSVDPTITGTGEARVNVVGILEEV